MYHRTMHDGNTDLFHHEKRRKERVTKKVGHEELLIQADVGLEKILVTLCLCLTGRQCNVIDRNAAVLVPVRLMPAVRYSYPRSAPILRGFSSRVCPSVPPSVLTNVVAEC
jgi:hypothetical protein